MPGIAEADFGRFDVATVIKRIYILFCNSQMPIASDTENTLDLVKASDPLPYWMTEEDLQVYAGLYENSGFGYPLEVPYRARSDKDFFHFHLATSASPQVRAYTCMQGE